MNPTRLLLVLLAVVLMIGCAASAKKMNRLQLGMSKNQVIEAIGRPNSTSSRQNVELLKYRFKSSGLWTTVYYVQLESGKVNAFGEVGDFGLGY